MSSELYEIESRQETIPEAQKLLPAILVSLLFHGVLAAVFLNGQIGGENADRLAVSSSLVSVRLYPHNPQILQVSEPVSRAEERATPVAIEVDDSSSAELLIQENTGVAEFDSSPEPMSGDLVDIQSEQRNTDVEEIAPVQGLANPLPAIRLPSVLMVQESLQDIDAQTRPQFYSHRCSPLEEDAGIRDCESSQQGELQSADYQDKQRNSTYRALNPIRQLSRTQRTSKVVSTQSKALAGRLGELRIPPGLSDYVLEELEAGITHNADLGHRAVEHMVNTNDKSAAGAIARELLSDPWVKQRSKELLQRKVHLPN